MTQEFYISVTPLKGNEYLVRTERVAPGVPLAEEQVTWAVEEWLAQASLLMDDPLLGVLRGDRLTNPTLAQGDRDPVAQLLAAQPDQPSADLVAFGQKLYSALFQGTIRDSWLTAQGIAQHRQEVLRLRLGLKGSLLHRVPWEVLHAGDRPLATGTDVIFSRYHSNFAGVTTPHPITGLTSDPNQPLNILMVLAAPTDQEMLALKQEALDLQEELSQPLRSPGTWFSDIQLTLLEQPGREQLTQALEQNHYQVLHYAGHSNLGASGGSLYLVNPQTGLTEVLNGDDLAGLLVNNGICMAVFNSCRGVYTASAEAFGNSGDGNLAEALVKRGIPAILAMAERIPDKVALTLSRLFYRNLKQGCPVDVSLSRARQGLVSSYCSNQLYWALPILYLHQEFDGYLQAQPAMRQEASKALTWMNGDTGRSPSLPEYYGNISDFDRADLEAFEAGIYAEDGSIVDELLPDDLELYDPTPPADLDQVAGMVDELSESSTTTSWQEEEPILPALEAESLLPATAQAETEQEAQFDHYLARIGQPRYPTTSSLSIASPFGQGTARSEVAIAPTITTGNAALYSEIASVLSDIGKLTPAIAASIRVVQEQPQDAKAYTNLGWTLYQHGLLNEAIAAYQQALQLQPNLAEAYYRLGFALRQQGHLGDADQVFNRAIQLDPNLVSIDSDLAAALRQRGNVPVVASHAPPTDRTANKSAPRSWLWTGVGALGLTLVLAGSWGVYSWITSSPLSLLPPQTQNSENRDPNSLKRVKTEQVAAWATEQLQQGNIAAAQPMIEALLDRGALAQAAAVMTPVVTQHAKDPTLNFLMGRLAWQQSLLAENTNYSLHDARRFWETATREQPSARYLNALGFAYYAEGQFDRADGTWSRALRLAGQQTDESTTQGTVPITNLNSEQEALTSYAGWALTLAKTAQTQPPDQRASLMNEAIKLRQKVLEADPVNFQPDVLGKNWMWSEAAIRDWRSLLQQK
ncbi:CHAT domain-containing protein [Pantanalinema rosaneae CENA516]|uniref:CHAT domain-containing protein n=1 Tax=Pantanalinema rosaneae TaxID=1620701 RepID=UPI003D70113C